MEKIELFNSADYHAIVIEFQDKTALELEIEPAFALKAVQQDLKPDDAKVLRRLPAVHSQPWNV